MGLPSEAPPAWAAAEDGLPTPAWAARPRWWRRGPRSVRALVAVLGLTGLAAMMGAFDGAGDTRRQILAAMDAAPVHAPAPAPAPLAWQPARGCRNTPAGTTPFRAPLRFGGGHKLALEEAVARHSGEGARAVRVTGEIVLRALEGDGEGSVEVEAVANDDALRPRLDDDLHGDNMRLRIVAPAVVPWEGGADDDGPCLQVRATVWVPRGALLRRLRVDAARLDVRLADGLVLGVGKGGSRLRTVAGRVEAGGAVDKDDDDDDDAAPPSYTLATRDLAVESVSGRIAGAFALYSRLRLATVSGGVAASIAPQAVPGGARLDARSVSGPLRLRTAGGNATALPARDYRVRLETVSGKVEAALPLGREARVRSVAGPVALALRPVVDARRRRRADVRTDVRSAAVRLTVLEPVAGRDGDDKDDKDDDKERNAAPPLRLRSRHRSVSGDLELALPAAWRGAFTAKTLAGDISATGPGLRLVRRGRNFMRFLDGRRGDDGGSCSKIESLSGNINLKAA